MIILELDPRQAPPEIVDAVAKVLCDRFGHSPRLNAKSLVSLLTNAFSKASSRLLIDALDDHRRALARDPRDDSDDPEVVQKLVDDLAVCNGAMRLLATRRAA